MNRHARLARNAPNARLVLKGVAVGVMLAFGSHAWALPTSGTVSAGSASIASGPGAMTITQSSQNAAINWQGFSIGQGEAVRFVQPNSAAVALNRVLGPDPSSILGSLSANGKVFLVNPNGILFGQGAQVNVGGLVASTLNITDADFMAGRYNFAGTGGGAVRNQGSINADGGYVALLGANVSNEGTIAARLGTVVLASGNAMTLDVAGDGLLNVVVNEGAVDALARNGGLIRADGGKVLLTARSAGNLLQAVVNNTGVIQAQTIGNRGGTILLMGDMQTGTVDLGGTLDASAPGGGDGGFIETSAAFVSVRADASVTTAAPLGQTGTWLIDPLDFRIGSAPGDNITGAALSAQLVDNNVIIATVAGPGPGNGDIFVTEAVAWNGALGVSAVPTTLTLNALRDVNINAAISPTNGNLVVCCGRDVNLNLTGAITATDGSVLLAGNGNVNLLGAITATRGNIAVCAGHDVIVNSALTLTDPTLDPVRSLGLNPGLTLSAGLDGTGPGVAGGTVTFVPLTPPAAITRAPVVVTYNPVSYAAPTDYNTAAFFTLVGPGATVTSRMLVFPDGGSKAFDGTTATALAGLKGLPPGVTLDGVGTANFDTADVGLNKTVTFTGFTLGGPNAADYALATACCGPIVSRTTANITPIAPAAVIVPVLAEDAALPVFQMQAGILPAFVFEPVDLTVTESIPPLVSVVEPRPAPPAVVAPPVVTPPPAPAPVVVPPLPPRPDRN